MRFTIPRKAARVAAVVAAVAGLGATVAVPVAASAAPGNGASGRDYLALGDSVAFGFVPSAAVPPPNYADAASFTSYANDVASAFHLRLANASCPGETTISMLAAGGLSNGCENSPVSSVGYRTAYPLHVSYSGTQEAFAVDYLRNHPSTSLVTINIGANDAFICQEVTADHCTSQAELSAVLSQITQNLGAILAGIRYVGGYQRTVVVLDYYSLSYTDPAQIAQTKALNAAINAAARQYQATVADGYGAFRLASARSGGDPCAAGLLIRLSSTSCNIHPSPAGHLVLAGAIAAALH